jgi:hypothetical protein
MILGLRFGVDGLSVLTMDHFEIRERVAIAPFLFVIVPVLADFQRFE